MQSRRVVAAQARAGVGASTGALLVLDVSFNRLGDAAGVALAECLVEEPLAPLRTLDASRNRLGDRAAVAFAAALAGGARKLETLKLGWNPLGTAGALAVARPRRGEVSDACLRRATTPRSRGDAAADRPRTVRRPSVDRPDRPRTVRGPFADRIRAVRGLCWQTHPAVVGLSESGHPVIRQSGCNPEIQ